MPRFPHLSSLTTLTLALVACTTPPAPPPESAPARAPASRATTPPSLSDDERQGMALLVLGPKPHPVKSCVVSALELNTGLIASKLGKTPDDKLRAQLVDGTQGSLLALREKQFAAWKAGGSPADLADMNFAYCIAQAKITVPPHPLTKTCFSVAAVPAYGEAEKVAGHDRATAVARLQKAFAPQLPAEFVRTTTEDVYASDSGKDSYAAHRKVFAQCFLQVK